MEKDKSLRLKYSLGEIVVATGKVESFREREFQEKPENWIVPSGWRNKEPERDGKRYSTYARLYMCIAKEDFGFPWLQVSEFLPCMMLGWTTRYIGEINVGSPPRGDYDDGEPGWIDVEHRLLVYVVQPISRDGRYRKPITVFPEQLLTKEDTEKWLMTNSISSIERTAEGLYRMLSSTPSLIPLQTST